MTLDEFKKNNGDVMLSEPSWDELKTMANGAALFYVSLSTGRKPKNQRAIKWAGHALTAGMTADGGLELLRLTAEGNPKLCVVYPANTAPDGSAALYLTAPIPEWDRRNLESWNHWD